MKLSMEEPAQERSYKSYVKQVIRHRAKRRENPPPQPTKEEELLQLELSAMRKHHDPFEGKPMESRGPLPYKSTYPKELSKKQKILNMIWELAKLGAVVSFGIWVWLLVHGQG